MEESLHSKRKNILIVNLHSAQNLGDDAIMHETLRGLRELYPKCHITLAANDPASWRKFTETEVVSSLTTWALSLQDRRWRLRLPHIPIDIFNLLLATILYRLKRRKYLFGSDEQRKLLSAYYNADVILSCGGGNFIAYRSFSPFFLWGLLALWLATSLDKKVFMLPQSIGPISGRLQKYLARRIFGKVDLIMAREMLTFDFLSRELGLTKSVFFVPDLAFNLPAVLPKLPISLPCTDHSLKIGLTIMDRGAQTKSFSAQQKYEDTLQSLIEKLLANKPDICICLFSQSYGPGIDHDDRQIVRRVYERLKDGSGRVVLLSDFHDALEIKSAYKCMDCVIGTRLHTGIFAISEKVPILLIGYQPKTFGIMQSLGLEEYCVDIEILDAESLYKKILLVIENCPKIVEKTQHHLEQIHKQLDDWYQYIEF
jgi:colanic acid/amylovoran biosynthesis protein